VLPSASTLRNICRKEYVLTVDAIRKLLLSQDKVYLAFDGWTSMYKLAITSVIAYYKDLNWGLDEVQLAIDKDKCLFFSTSES
jgi:hypothetical protein